MKELTKAEEQVMQVLWQIERGVIHDIIGKLPEPKPAYNTVSTIVRILEKKEFVSHKAYGKTHEYFPIIEKTIYSNFYLKNFMKGYFSGSFQSMVSFFAKENNLTINELDELMKNVKAGLNNEDYDNNN